MTKTQPQARYKAVMLVDDQEIDKLICVKMMEAFHFAEHIHVYSSGTGAIEFLRNLVRNPDISEMLIPDYIFLDINMPLMDGFQFMEEFKKLPEEITQKARVVMLSSYPNLNEIEQSHRIPGVYQYVSKPLSQETLEQL